VMRFLYSALVRIRAARLHHARSATELYFAVRLESRFRGAHDILHPGPREMTLS
jgi:hypothetical protein